MCVLKTSGKKDASDFFDIKKSLQLNCLKILEAASKLFFIS
jgi:hypothetical protein